MSPNDLSPAAAGGPRKLACTEILGGIGPSDICVLLPGLRGECWAIPYEGGEAGGDIHFVSACSDNTLAKVLVADVSGHGVEVAEVARLLHHAVARHIQERDNVGFLRTVNQAFTGINPRDEHFGTMVSTIYDSSQRTLTYAYAGHPPVLHGRRATGRFQAVSPAQGPRGGLPIGVLLNTPYAEHTTHLEPGDAIVLYTDALLEKTLPHGERVGQEGLTRILESAGSLRCADLKRRLVEVLGTQFDDDMTAIILEVL